MGKRPCHVQVATIRTISFLKAVKKFKTQLSAGTVTENVFWNSKGMIQVYFLPCGVKNNTQYYSNMFRKDEHSEQMTSDNARQHTTNLTKAILAPMGWEITSHPLYSPCPRPQ